MIKQKVLIINFNSLFEILNEIKENLPFEIIKNEKLKKNLSLKTYLGVMILMIKDIIKKLKFLPKRVERGFIEQIINMIT